MIFKSLKALIIIARLAPRRRFVFDFDADRESDFAGRLDARTRHFKGDRYTKGLESFRSKNLCAKARARASTIDRELCVCIWVYVYIYIYLESRAERTIPCSLAWKTSGTSRRFVTSNGDSFEWYKTVRSILEYDICRFTYVYTCMHVSFPRFIQSCATIAP